MYLYGASGHCKVVIDIITTVGESKIRGILDDNPKLHSIYGIPVFNTKDFETFDDKNLIITIGDNRIRKNIAENISAFYKTAIHPKSTVSSYAKISEGTVVMAKAILNPDAIIGKHCIINTGAVIEHDSILDDFVHISPNATLAGNVQIGEGTHIGIGALVIQGVKIGKWVTIGAGAVIIKDIPDYAVVVGNPGKIIKYNTPRFLI
jgi:sugar O-acyltransferase (sialic acid O-acetyltransferase NeuD family)